MRKKIIASFILVIIGCLLSSCSNQVVEFAFDNKISWSSTYDDIIRYYGQTYKTVLAHDSSSESEYSDDESYAIEYSPFNCCGYPDYNLNFVYNSTKSKITHILVWKSFEETKKCDKEAEQILSSLESKYGKPEKKEAPTDLPEGIEYVTFYTWNSQIKDTTLNYYITHVKETELYNMSIFYINKSKQTNGI